MAWLLSIPLPSLAQTTFKPTSSQTQPILTGVFYLEDPAQQYSFDDIISARTPPFVARTKTNMGFGHKGVMWFKINVDLNGYHDTLWFLTQKFVHVGQLDVYYQLPNSQFQRATLGESTPIEQRPFKLHNYIYPIPNLKTVQTIYLRLDPHGHAINVDLNWHSTESLTEYLSYQNLFMGLFFCALIVLWVYNAFIYSIVQTKEYLYYAYYLGNFIVVFAYLNGLAPYLGPVTSLTESLYAAAGFCAVHGLILFARSFLLLPATSPKLNRFLSFCQWLLIALGIFSFVSPFNPFIFINVLILLTVPILFFSGLKRCFDRYQPAYFYTVGWMFFMISLLTYSLRAIGVISPNFFNEYGLLWASVWEALLFAFALGYRMKLNEREKNDLITSNQQREVEILQNERQVLEERVNERTAELQLSLREIQSQHEDIERHNSDRKILIASINQKIEAERRSIAGDLHDTLNTVVLTIIGHARNLKSYWSTSEGSHQTPEVKLHLDSATAIEESGQYLYSLARNLMANLRPEVLEEFGLGESLRMFVNAQNKLYPQCYFQYHVDDPFPLLNYNFNIVLYRIVQECISNIIKHAQASNVTIVLNAECKVDGYFVRLTVMDDGVGFNPQHVRRSTGLIGMQERVESVGGLLTIESNEKGSILAFTCFIEESSKT